MVINTQVLDTGVELEIGDTLEGKKYDLVADERPKGLYNEFLDEYGFNDETVVNDATEFIDEELAHTYELAEMEDLDPEEIDRERRKVQGDISEVNLSDVWNKEYKGFRAGTCRERAASLHLLLNELGIDSNYHSGFTDETRERGHSWVQSDSTTVLDPSADEYVFNKRDSTLETGRVFIRSNSTKDAYGQVLS